ncbi:hypothetical protein Kpol_1014p22 [Vanderwaltozyma polyspora DSM 70294]|uniref:Eukaryotic translation initiation factor 4E n=1 Tax=Vanderwaltozyma polyspora (strain ATCC 22028 / DSM 70294 / BCRC 21397 / CBS 2163 / NBRC 10782 / NRRL Y-8283 / UCD 57-17) TaxID=436907 RepID=A7TNF0_VANPO|nr:uncharacterized protein Kpol_1014p22 [Vanderwaltozyma polyspora DSM 70294]EDO16203.1 hypothetical protein Kpol_1014p22 [Vanderwaltozyma polyspora DSM 70294]
MSVEEVSKKFEETVSVSGKVQVQHPLNSKWTLWYTKPAVDKSESWSDLLRPVTSFGSVEEFWAVHENVPVPHELPLKSDYHIFRDQIRPEWEDTANAKGGKWSFQLRGGHGDVDELWLRALLSVIGETIDEEDSQINGIVLSVRRGTYKFALWTKSQEKEALCNIGARFKEVLKLGEEEKIEFFPHSASTAKHAQPAIIL